MHIMWLFLLHFWFLLKNKIGRRTLIGSKKKKIKTDISREKREEKKYLEKGSLVSAELRIRVQIMHVESTSALLASRASMSSSLSSTVTIDAPSSYSSLHSTCSGNVLEFPSDAKSSSRGKVVPVPVPQVWGPCCFTQTSRLDKTEMNSFYNTRNMQLRFRNYL